MSKWHLQPSRPWLTLLLSAVLGIFWYLFAPTGLGGQAAYIIIRGNSMEPLFHTGDLVILRDEKHAQVGDIFAYQHPELGIIIHRIVNIREDRYIFQGDNNDWLDSYLPAKEDLVGKAWIHIAGAGNGVVWLRKPVNASLITAITGGFLMFGLVSNPSKKTKHKKRRFRLPELSIFENDPSSQETVLIILSLSLFLAVTLGLLSFTQPAMLTEENNILYTHKIAFEYTGKANPNVYDQPTIQAGEPLFLALSCTLDISIVYALASAEPIDANGSYRVAAMVSEPNGWKRTVELVPETSFDNGRFGTQTSVDICSIRRIIEQMTNLTGMNRNIYDVKIVTEIELTGEIDGYAYHETISPSLDFGLDSVQLFLRKDSVEGNEPLSWESVGYISRTHRVPNKLSFFGLNLSVLFVRIFAITLFLVTVSGGILFSLPLLSTSKKPIDTIRARYGSLIIHAENLPAPKKSQPIIIVRSINDLVRLAQQSGSMILETVHDSEYRFSIILDTAIYSYTIQDEADVSGSME
ncbi:MAG: hypothetical protein Kow002_07410 [Anaerolineales bacterium]